MHRRDFLRSALALGAASALGPPAVWAKGEPDALLSRDAAERHRAVDARLDAVRAGKDDRSARREAARQIDQLRVLARKQKLETAKDFFRERARYARKLERERFDWAKAFQPELFREELLAAVDDALCHFLQALELRWLAGKGVETPRGMVLVPAGRFIKGSEHAEARHFHNVYHFGLPESRRPAIPPDVTKRVDYGDIRGFIAEVPRRPTHIARSFWMEVLPVTMADAARYARESGVPSRGTLHNVDTRGFTWKDGQTPMPGTERHPFIYASQTSGGAMAAHWGKRLPSAEEWEYAARGLAGRIWPWGNAFMRSYAHAADKPWKRPLIVPVGRYPRDRSPFGALDMGGNGGEWTGSPFKHAVTTSWDQPITGLEPVKGLGLTKSGGGWTLGTDMSECRCARGSPMAIDAWYKIGFRVAKDVPEQYLG